MKGIKTYLNIGTVILTAWVAITLAQPQPDHRINQEQMIAQRLEKLNQALQLSAQQKEKIKSLLESEFVTRDKKMIARHQEGKQQDFEQMRTDMEKIINETNQKIREILTEKQQKAFTEYLNTE